MARGSRRQWTEGVRIVATLVGFFLVWEAGTRLLRAPEYILPAPSAIFAGMAESSSHLVAATLFTLRPMLVGFAMAVVVGVGLALLIAFSRVVESTLYPLIVLLQIVPKIAVAPLFIIWFGFGLIPKVLLVFLLSFFPIVVGSITAFKSVDPDILDLARSSGAKPLRIFWMVQLPHALPMLFAGFKVAAALSATAAVVAEFVASDRGLGYLLLHYNGNLNTTMTFATILVLSALGLALYGIVELIERLAIPWHVSQRRTELELSNP